MDLADPAQVAAAAWEDHFGAAPVPQDHFFAAGGDSFDAARFVRRISAALGVTLPIKALFEHPVYADFCDYLASVEPPPSATQAPATEAPATEAPDGRGETHSLTPAQRRLWLHHRAHPESWTYHVPTVLTLRGPVRKDLLERALSAVVARHEPLRTTYEEAPQVRDGLPVASARIHPPRPVGVDLRVVADEVEAEAVVTQVIATPFDLADAAPVRAALVQLGPDEHWLVLVVHHIATDGDAQQLLVDELAAHYDAMARSLPVALSGLPIPYRQVTAAAAAGGLPEHLDLDRFRGASGGSPTTVGDPSAPAGTTARAVRLLGASATADVNAVAVAGRTTAYAVLLGLFAEQLARQTDRDRVIIGFPVSARDTAHSELVVGLLVDTRAVAIDTSGRPDLLTLTERASAEVLAARRCPGEIEQISDGLGLGEGVPLFRTWFNHLGRVTDPPSLPGLRVGYREPPHPPALFDLNLYLSEHDDDIEVALLHDRAVLDDDEAAALLDQYVELVRAAAAEPCQAVRGIAIGQPCSGGAVAIAPGASGPPRFSDRWAAVVSASPDAEAVRGAGRALTRIRLAEAVEYLADALRDVGCGPGCTVAVEVERSPAVLVAVLATWRLGAEVLVCDPQHPEARRTSHLVAAGATVAIRGDGVSGCVVPAELRIDTWGAVTAATPRPAATPHPVETDPSPPVPRYVAFTSGTTGRPVGVRSDLRPVEHFLEWYARDFGVGEHDRISVLAGLSHDPLLREVLLGAWSGAVTCVPEPSLLLDPEALARWLARERITVLHATPPLARLLAGTETEVPDVRLLCLGGADLTLDDVARLQRWAPAATILNGYGTTETPQLASYGVVRAGRPPDIGRGAPGSDLLVVDEDGRPCETGRPGRILVRSSHLVAPVDVAGADLVGFDDDRVRGVRRFATGDRGLRLVDGNVRFLGRDDGLVDIRGHRVHPGETDLALRTISGVLDCITLAQPGTDGSQLVSYVAASGLTPVRIRRTVARLLPAPSVPEQVVVLDRMPMTPNGKVDLARLPDPGSDGSVHDPAARPPGAGDAVEQRLHRLVAATFGADDFAATDSFFDLGGSSLTMLRLHTTLQREIAPSLTVVDLYENPTVRRLAQYLGDSDCRALTPRGGTAKRADQRTRRMYARSSLRPDHAGGGGRD